MRDTLPRLAHSIAFRRSFRSLDLARNIVDHCSCRSWRFRLTPRLCEAWFQASFDLVCDGHEFHNHGQLGSDLGTAAIHPHPRRACTNSGLSAVCWPRGLLDCLRPRAQLHLGAALDSLPARLMSTKTGRWSLAKVPCFSIIATPELLRFTRPSMPERASLPK